jgi:aminopeptidase
MQTIYDRYAHLLVHYCLELQAGEKVQFRSTHLAEPLLQALMRECLEAGAHPHFDVSFRDQDRLFLEHANDAQLSYVPTAYSEALETFDAYAVIIAPFNTKHLQNVDAAKSKALSAARSKSRSIYMQRTATREMKRTLCVFPTEAAAQEAGMSLPEYQDFVFAACKLDQEDPKAAWLQVRAEQQAVVDKLNSCTEVRYVNADSDISFRTEGRIWMNSDGQTNMPSGEVYTSPIEDSVNGHIRFNYPGIFMGREIEDIRLQVKDGEVVKWEAKRGQELLDKLLETPGARRFGEAAIGTNYNIDRLTRNMLFDEKMGGTIHMALGQSYPATGGKNQSDVHWDLLANMRDGGQIFADGERIYENGRFTF